MGSASVRHFFVSTDFAIRRGYKFYKKIIEAKDNSRNYGDTFCLKFYSDDVSLRLYSASEHLANAKINMLEIKESELNNYKKKYSSISSMLAQYLKNHHPNDEITNIILDLYNSSKSNKSR